MKIKKRLTVFMLCSALIIFIASVTFSENDHMTHPPFDMITDEQAKQLSEYLSDFYPVNAPLDEYLPPNLRSLITTPKNDLRNFAKVDAQHNPKSGPYSVQISPRYMLSILFLSDAQTYKLTFNRVLFSEEEISEIAHVADSVVIELKSLKQEGYGLNTKLINFLDSLYPELGSRSQRSVSVVGVSEDVARIILNANYDLYIRKLKFKNGYNNGLSQEKGVYLYVITIQPQAKH